MFRENYKIFLIPLPVLFLLCGYIIRFLILNIPYSQGIDFVDFYIYKETYSYYPERIYEYPLYIYLPQFLIEFFWINLYPLDVGKVMWSVLKLGLITIIWSIIVLEDYFDKIESLMFIILVLILGFLNDFILGNSDTILLFCGFFGYYILDKTEQLNSNKLELANQGLKKKIFNKSSILTLISGILTGFALYKPLFFPFALLLLLKSKHKGIFISSLLSWILILNIQLFIFPNQISQYAYKVLNTAEFIKVEAFLNHSILNAIFRNIFTPIHQQMYLYPLIILTLRMFVKNKSIRIKIILIYGTGYILFIFSGILLHILGF